MGSLGNMGHEGFGKTGKQNSGTQITDPLYATSRAITRRYLGPGVWIVYWDFLIHQYGVMIIERLASRNRPMRGSSSLAGGVRAEHTWDALLHLMPLVGPSRNSGILYFSREPTNHKPRLKMIHALLSQSLHFSSKQSLETFMG